MQDTKQLEQVWQLSTSYIKHIEIWTIKSTQDIKHKWVEREMSNRKHERIISRFEPLALRSSLHRNEGFPLKMIPQDHLCHNTYNEPLLKLLDSQVSHLFPQEQHTRTHKLVETQPLQLLKYKGWNTCDHFSFSQKQTLSHTRIPGGYI